MCLFACEEQVYFACEKQDCIPRHRRTFNCHDAIFVPLECVGGAGEVLVLSGWLVGCFKCLHSICVLHCFFPMMICCCFEDRGWLWV